MILNSKPAVDTFETSFTDEKKSIHSKFEHDLYKEEDDLAFKVIRVKHINLPNKGDKWKILNDNKVVNLIDGSKLTNKEKDFLKTADGMVWLLEVSKLGINSFNSFKKDLKKKLSNS